MGSFSCVKWRASCKVPNMSVHFCDGYLNLCRVRLESIQSASFYMLFFAWLLACSAVHADTQTPAQVLHLPLENQWRSARTLPDHGVVAPKGKTNAGQLSEPATSPTPSESGSDRLPIGVGDQIFITVFGQPDMSAEVTVNENQQVTLPLIGTLKVGGLAPPAIEKLIAQRLKDGEYLLNPEVSIQVRQVRSQMMSVLGEVQRPGRFVISAKMSVLDALAMAGGLTPRADQTVILIRNNRDPKGELLRQEISVHLDQLTNAKPSQRDMELMNDDVVFVPLQKSFYVLGEIRKPGAYPMEQDLNVMRALAISGGITDRGSLRRIRIHRKDANQSLQEITPDLKTPIVGGDVIYVDERLF